MPRLVVSIPGRQPQPFRFQLNHPPMTIGRAEDNQVYLDDASVSQHHCVLQRVPGGYILRDSGSTNGIKLNGVRMGIIDLFPGVDVRIGDVDAVIEFDPSETAILEVEPRQFMGVKLEDMESPPVPEPKSNLSNTAIHDISAFDNQAPLYAPLSRTADPAPAPAAYVYDEEPDPAPQEFESPVPPNGQLSAFSAKPKLPVYKKPPLFSAGFVIWLLFLAVIGSAVGLYLHFHQATGGHLPWN